jgi:two-component system, NarL family, sensor histidine kinase BarA
MWRGISLANKCLLLFGGAVVLVVLIALAAPWLRMSNLVDEGQRDVSRAMVASWEAVERSPETPTPPPGREVEPRTLAGVYAARLSVEQARDVGGGGAGRGFVGRALEALEAEPGLADVQESSWIGTQREYRYAKAVRDAQRELVGLIILDRRSVEAGAMLLVNSGYLLSAGAFVLIIAVLLFYVITHKLVLSPVRTLRETAEKVREGDLTARSEIRTGDEFEELAEAFNQMLVDLSGSQDQLRAINRAMDLKLTELSEMNTTLHEAAKLKGDFLANISHELRTPLNSIIGFAELLLEVARADAAADNPPPSAVKRVRYLENIHTAAKTLLEMINELLDMAKLESGKIDLTIGRMNVHDTCEGLLGLLWPQAERKGLTLKLECPEDLPVVETDVKKFQQIIFNLLSNAVKFTEPPGKTGRLVEAVTLRAEKLTGVSPGGGAADQIRVSVIDTGPGIPPEEHEKIFEKFYQLSGGHTREHSGTGLGLAICKEFAAILQGEIQMVSEPGNGSMFSLIIPVTIDAEEAAVRKLEGKFRGTLAGRRAW